MSPTNWEDRGSAWTNSADTGVNENGRLVRRPFCSGLRAGSNADQCDFFETDVPALLNPFVLWSPGVEVEIAVALVTPRVSLELAMPEVVTP